MATKVAVTRRGEHPNYRPGAASSVLERGVRLSLRVAGGAGVLPDVPDAVTVCAAAGEVPLR
jgi:hypothetical protein